MDLNYLGLVSSAGLLTSDCLGSRLSAPLPLPLEL